MTERRRGLLRGQERVARMIKRRDQDRIPRHESFWPDTIRRWQGEGLDGDAETVLDLLGSDFQSVNWCWPVAFPGQEQILSEDEQTKVVRSGQGNVSRWWKHRSGTPEHIAFGCDSRDAWEKIYKPALLKNALQTPLAKIKDAYRVGRAAGRWCHLTGVEPFEEMRSLMGDEITLIAMADEPDWVIDVARVFTDVVLLNLQSVLDAGIQPDGLWIYGDMAYNHATVCSPAMYRELIWPQHKRLAEWAHAHGMSFIYHTDGDVRGVLDLYIAAGFDCLQPLEAKASMDVRRLCPRYGERLAMFGNIDVMKMATNDLTLIEGEIRSKLAAGMETRGYAYHSDHSVPPQVSWQTYQKIIHLIDLHGCYEKP
jgi:uroporphyrinogen decarboxylase